MREELLFLESKNYIIPMKRTSHNEGVLVANATKDPPRKMTFWTRGDRSAAEKLQIINLDTLGVVSMPEKKTTIQRTDTIKNTLKTNQRTYTLGMIYKSVAKEALKLLHIEKMSQRERERQR